MFYQYSHLDTNRELSVYMRHSFTFNLENHLVDCGENVEVLSITLHFAQTPLRLCNIYRSPCATLQMNEQFCVLAMEFFSVVVDFSAHHTLLASMGERNKTGSHKHLTLEQSGEIVLLNDVVQPTHTEADLDLSLTIRHLSPNIQRAVHASLTSHHLARSPLPNLHRDFPLTGLCKILF